MHRRNIVLDRYDNIKITAIQVRIIIYFFPSPPTISRVHNVIYTDIVTHIAVTVIERVINIDFIGFFFFFSI